MKGVSVIWNRLRYLAPPVAAVVAGLLSVASFPWNYATAVVFLFVSVCVLVAWISCAETRQEPTAGMPRYLFLALMGIVFLCGLRIVANSSLPFLSIFLLGLASVWPSRFRRGAVSDRIAVQEMAAWTILGSGAAWMVGACTIYGWSITPLNKVMAPAICMFLGLLYGSRRFRDCYPIAFVGQIGGYLVGMSLPVTMGRGDDWDDYGIVCLGILITTCLSATLIAIALSVKILGTGPLHALRPMELCNMPPVPLRLPRSRFSSTHRLCAGLFAILLLGIVAPESRDGIAVKSLGYWRVKSSHDRLNSWWLRWVNLVLGGQSGMPKHFGANQLDDDQLHLVGHLATIEELDLGGARFTEAGWAHLQGLTRLKRVNLYDRRMSEADLAGIARLPSLETLALKSVTLPDHGVRALNSAKRLKQIILLGPNVPEKTQEEFRQTLPNGTVVRQ